MVLTDFGYRSSDWWANLLDALNSRHIPGRYQHGKRMLAGPMIGVATIYFSSDTVEIEEAVKILRENGFEVFREGIDEASLDGRRS